VQQDNEEDVLDVFDRDRISQREHLVSWRINWRSKSENVKSLSSELNLGWTVSSSLMTTG